MEKDQAKIGEKRAINYGFHDMMSGEEAYCVIERQNESDPSSRNYKWKMRDALYYEKDLEEICGITKPPKHFNLAQQCSEELKSKDVILDIINDGQSLDQLLSNTDWSKIDIFSKSKRPKAKRMTFSINKSEFLRICCNDINYRACNDNLIPILMFDANSHWVEFVRIFNIHRDVDIGISMKCDVNTKKLSITGIHLDKQKILEQHHLLFPDHRDAQYLDDFVCDIDELKINIQADHQRSHCFKVLLIRFA